MLLNCFATWIAAHNCKKPRWWIHKLVALKLSREWQQEETWMRGENNCLGGLITSSTVVAFARDWMNMSVGWQARVSEKALGVKQIELQLLHIPGELLWALGPHLILMSSSLMCRACFPAKANASPRSASIIKSLKECFERFFQLPTIVRAYRCRFGSGLHGRSLWLRGSHDFAAFVSPQPRKLQESFGPKAALQSRHAFVLEFRLPAISMALQRQ